MYTQIWINIEWHLFITKVYINTEKKRKTYIHHMIITCQKTCCKNIMRVCINSSNLCSYMQLCKLVPVFRMHEGITQAVAAYLLGMGCRLVLKRMTCFEAYSKRQVIKIFWIQLALIKNKVSICIWLSTAIYFEIKSYTSKSKFSGFYD